MGLKLPGELTPKQLAHVSQYALLQPGEQLLLLFDATLFNSADSGVALTDHRIAKYAKRALEWLAYEDIAGIRVEHDGTGISHTLHVTARDGHVAVVHLYLSATDLERVLAELRQRLPAGVGIGEPGADAEGSGRYSVADRTIACAHCGHAQLLARVVILQSRAFADGSPWTPRESAGLECVRCGHLALFTRAPQRLT